MAAVIDAKWLGRWNERATQQARETGARVTMCSFRRTRFRLLAATPLEVAFPSITYRLEILQVPVSGMWQLRAGYPGGYWLCAYQASEEALRKAVYEEGFELEGATVARMIFERLVKEGRAEVVM